MIEFNEVAGSIARRIARQIRIEPLPFGLPYRASLYLARWPVGVQHGHPWLLEADAATPQRAVSEVLDMLALWLLDPLDPELASVKLDDCERCVRRRVVPASRTPSPAPTTPRAP
ncbi:MAG: hypothetical protein ACHREM_26185 [Polyangiales bacterium]